MDSQPNILSSHVKGTREKRQTGRIFHEAYATGMRVLAEKTWLSWVDIKLADQY
jgi:hypothetical protein